MKKTVVMILALALMFVGLLPAMAEKLNGDITYLTPENVGEPITTSQIITGAVSTNKNGDPIAAATVSGDGDNATFNVVNLKTKAIEKSFKVTGEHFWTHAVDSLGNIYFAGYANAVLYKYSPADEQLHNLGSVGESAVCQIAIDDANNVYLGTYPNAKIIKYSAAGVKEDWGRQMTTNYFKSLAYHNGFLYGGGMGDGSPEFYKINTATKEKTAISLPSAVAGTVKSFYSARTVRDKIFFYTERTGGTNSYIILDTANGAFMDTKIDSKWGMYPTPEIDGFTYISVDGKSVKYNLDTNEQTDATLNAFTIRGGGVVTLDGNTDFPNKTFVNFNSSGYIELLDYEAGKRENYFSDFEPAGVELMGICEADGYVYTSGYMGPTSSNYDPDTQTASVSFSMGQSTPILKVGTKLYYGTYPGANLVVYDTTKAVSSENPKTLISLEEEKQDRPMSIIEANGKIIMGCVADYTSIRGGFAIYDPANDTHEFVSAPVDLGVTGIAYKNGFIYGSTTIHGGNNSTPTKTEAKLFKYDMTGKTMTEMSLTGTGQVAPKKFGGLVFGEDGLLWTVSHGLILGLNADTGAATKVITPNGYEAEPNKWIPNGIKFGPGGFLYAVANGKLFEVNTETLAYTDIAPGLSGISCMSISGDRKTIYVSNKSPDLYRIKMEYEVWTPFPQVYGYDNNSIYVSSTSETYTDDSGRTINDPFRGVIGASRNHEDYTLVECGMILSKRNISKMLFTLNNASVVKYTATPNMNGRYGILFYGLADNTTYYTRIYAKYTENSTQNVVVFYSDLINSFEK